MSRLPWVALIAVYLSLVVIGCGSVQQEKFTLDLKTQVDDGTPLGGVVVYFKDQPVGESTDAGKLQVVVAAVTGQSLPVRFECPEGYKASRDTVRVPLRSSGENSYQVVLDCKPFVRNAVVAITTNMANIPLFIGDERVGTTNQFGVAHVALVRAEQDDFAIRMETSSIEYLRPRNPVYQFKMPGHDEAFVVQETFFLDEPPPPPPKPKKKKKRRVKKKKKKRPTRLKGLKRDFGKLRKR